MNSSSGQVKMYRVTFFFFYILFYKTHKRDLTACPSRYVSTKFQKILYVISSIEIVVKKPFSEIPAFDFTNSFVGEGEGGVR